MTAGVGGRTVGMLGGWVKLPDMSRLPDLLLAGLPAIGAGAMSGLTLTGVWMGDGLAGAGLVGLATGGLTTGLLAMAGGLVANGVAAGFSGGSKSLMSGEIGAKTILVLLPVWIWTKRLSMRVMTGSGSGAAAARGACVAEWVDMVSL